MAALKNENGARSAVDLNRGPVGNLGQVAGHMADERYAAFASDLR